MKANWITEMIAKNNFLFATMPVKDGTVIFPIHIWMILAMQVISFITNLVLIGFEMIMNEKNTHGGARVGAGRKKGGMNAVKKENTRPEVVYLRMTTEQKKTLRIAAENAGMKMSDYIISKLF